MVTQVPDYNEPSSPSEPCGQGSCGDGRIRPSGGPEVPGRTAVAPSPIVNSGTAVQPKPAAPTIDPTHRKPPLGVKEVEAPKERRIAAAAGRSVS
jgi:hypothetical protein